MKRNRQIAILTIVLALTPGSRAAVQSKEQKSDQSVIKLSAELVQIDVLVTDKTNKPVAGLKREDFALRKKDKNATIRQEIDFSMILDGSSSPTGTESGGSSRVLQ